MRHRLLALLFLFVATTATPARAHETGGAQVTVTFRADQTWTADVRLDLEHLAESTRGPGTREYPSLERSLHREYGAALDRVAAAAHPAFDGRRVDLATLEVDAQLAGRSLRLRLAGPIPAGVDTFSWSFGPDAEQHLLTVRAEGEDTVVRQWVDAGGESKPFPLRAELVPPSRLDIARQYLTLGFTHIVPKGLDHILFVLGIFLLSPRLRPVLLQVTAFTVAHTLTLGLTIYGVVALPSRVVEPLIAVSIVYVAVENLLTRKLGPWRVALVFAFGLLHGMGFAGVLAELGLPRAEALPALLSFNVGVELGQLTVIALAWLLLALPFSQRQGYHRRVVVPASVAIAAVGLWWVVERVAGG